MSVLFCATFVIYLLVYFLRIKRDGIHLGLNLMVLAGIYLPMMLYFLRWSAYITEPPCDGFYLVFFYLNICMILYNLLTREKGISFQVEKIGFNSTLIIAADFAWLILFCIESYMGSGSIVPALRGIDIHTYSAPLIAFITRNQFPFMAVNYLAFKSCKQKKYLVACALFILIPVVLRNMRISAFIAAMQFAFLVLATKEPHKARSLKFLADVRFSRVFGATVVVFLAMAFVAWSSVMTNDRMSHYGKYDISYDSAIAYTGPEIASEILSVYYGYFPISFNNLNISIAHVGSQPTYLGVYSYPSLYFGILQFDNIFGLNDAYCDTLAYKTTVSSTVPTGFWPFYYEYGDACLIPIAFMVATAAFFMRRHQVLGTLKSLLSVSYVVPLLFFQSFQNLFFASFTPWGLILSAVLCSLCLSGERKQVFESTPPTSLRQR